MNNLLIRMRFIGTNYSGFAVQKNAVTICGKFQDAIEKLYGERLDVKGCSRTDSGVHAYCYCLSFKCEKSLPLKEVVNGLNRYLPPDIGVYEAEYVPPDFHARYNALQKEYVYKIWNAVPKNPFYDGLALHYKRKINLALVNVACKHLVGTYDFSAFCAKRSERKDDCVRTIYSAKFVKSGDLVEFYISGDGFLYNMVRVIVGTMLGVNEGRIKSYDVPQIIEDRDRSKAGVTVPSAGLYLNNVVY